MTELACKVGRLFSSFRIKERQIPLEYKCLVSLYFDGFLKDIQPFEVPDEGPGGLVRGVNQPGDLVGCDNGIAVQMIQQNSGVFGSFAEGQRNPLHFSCNISDCYPIFKRQPI